MPFHDPHELNTNATVTSATARLAIRLHLRMLIHLPQRVGPVRQARVLPVLPLRAPIATTHPDRRVSRRVRDQAVVPAGRTTAAAADCSRCRSLAGRGGGPPAARPPAGEPEDE